MVTSVVLYIVPPGRIAYWSEWRLWGLSKEQWDDLHIVLGFVFFITILFHIYFNWHSILAYLKNRARALHFNSTEFLASLLLVAVVGLGTYWKVPPFGWVLDLNTWFKDRAALVYGEPPYGHAELSPLRDFIRNVGVENETAKQRLQAHGITAEGGEPIGKIAERYGMSAKHLHLIIQPEADKPVGDTSMPERPEAGIGKKSIESFSERFGLDPDEVIKTLKEGGMEADRTTTLRDLSETYGKDPHTIYTFIRNKMHKE